MYPPEKLQLIGIERLGSQADAVDTRCGERLDESLVERARIGLDGKLGALIRKRGKHRQ